jgi:hypothetical protein
MKLFFYHITYLGSNLADFILEAKNEKEAYSMAIDYANDWGVFKPIIKIEQTKSLLEGGKHYVF